MKALALPALFDNDTGPLSPSLLLDRTTAREHGWKYKRTPGSGGLRRTWRRAELSLEKCSNVALVYMLFCIYTQTSFYIMLMDEVNIHVPASLHRLYKYSRRPFHSAPGHVLTVKRNLHHVVKRSANQRWLLIPPPFSFPACLPVGPLCTTTTSTTSTAAASA